MTPHSEDLMSRVGTVLLRYADATDLTLADIRPTMQVFGPDGIITDSLQVLDALCDIETTLGLTVPDEDLTEELFASVGNLVGYLGVRVMATEDA